jgi:hypothetical protein
MASGTITTEVGAGPMLPCKPGALPSSRCTRRLAALSRAESPSAGTSTLTGLTTLDRLPWPEGGQGSGTPIRPVHKSPCTVRTDPLGRVGHRAWPRRSTIGHPACSPTRSSVRASRSDADPRQEHEARALPPPQHHDAALAEHARKTNEGPWIARH